jgi:hypothetical protein
LWVGTPFDLIITAAVIDRVDAFNGRLRLADIQIHFAVSKRCQHLVQDLEKVTLEDLKKERDTKEITHASDGVGYMIEYESNRPSMRVQRLS